MPTEVSPLVAQALNSAHKTLLLGQHFLGRSQTENPFLAAAAVAGYQPSFYRAWLEAKTPLDDRAKDVFSIGRSVSVSDEVTGLLQQPWNWVFTSAVDALTTRLLQIPGFRDVNQITSPSFDNVSDAAYVKLVRLFGTVDKGLHSELPPADAEYLRRRRQDVREMLGHLPEIVGPSGYLLIDGWRPGKDWLKIQDIVTALFSFLPDQVLLFGLTDEEAEPLKDDEDFATLISRGIVRIYQEPLAAIYREAVSNGVVQAHSELIGVNKVFFSVLKHSPPPDALVPPPEGDLTNIVVERMQWRRFSQTMQIIEPIDPTAPLSDLPEERYQVFREFLQDGLGRDKWKWLQHVAFRRPALIQIKQKVLSLMQEAAPQDHSIVLYGQSGSGKTILLQLLALELRQRGIPVVYFPGGLLSPDPALMDAFCLMLETESSCPVVFIVDATQDDTNYVRLSEFLASLGRKGLVVGSSRPAQLRDTNDAKGGKRRAGARVHKVEISAEMDSEEQNSLLQHLEGFLPKCSEPLSFLLSEGGVSNFFVALYRLLPVVRPKLESGIVDELTHAAEFIREQLRSALESERDAVPETALALKLSNALRERHEEFFRELQEVRSADGVTPAVVPNDGMDVALTLVHATMLATRLGLPLPQSMALRLIANDFALYRTGARVSFIQEVECEDGTIVLKARTPLEAEIWIKDRLQRDEDKLQVVRQIVGQLRQGEPNQDRNPQFEFVVKLFQALGPAGERSLQMRRHFWDLADIVDELRKRIQSVHPRLLLIESHLLREWVLTELRTTGATSASTEQLTEWNDALDRAQQCCDAAIEGLHKEHPDRIPSSARRLLATLETERACIFGSMIGNINRALRNKDAERRLWVPKVDGFFANAREAWRRSLEYEESDMWAIDSACWITGERYTFGELDDVAKAEMLADWTDLIDRYHELDLLPSQFDTRDGRAATLHRYFADKDSIEALDKLCRERGSLAVVTLNARWLAETDKTEARRYLENECGDHLLTDRHALLLYMRLWWETETGLSEFFPEDRLRLQFSVDKWTRLLEICEARLLLSGEQRNPTVLFLTACAYMHLDLVQEATKRFDLLERMNVGGYRRARSLLQLTDAEGQPCALTAEVRGGRRPLAWCEALRMNVAFNPGEHGIGRPQPGMRIGPFHLSFNYRGPYAEPLFRSGRADRTGVRPR